MSTVVRCFPLPLFEDNARHKVRMRARAPGRSVHRNSSGLNILQRRGPREENPMVRRISNLCETTYSPYLALYYFQLELVATYDQSLDQEVESGGREGEGPPREEREGGWTRRGHLHLRQLRAESLKAWPGSCTSDTIRST
jgi:hypothetical protein